MRMGNRNWLWIRLIVGVLAFSCHVVVAAQRRPIFENEVEYKITASACTDITLPNGWGLPDELPKKGIELDFLGDFRDLRFRQFATNPISVAVGISGYYSVTGTVPAPKKYAFTPGLPGSVRLIPDEEWQAAKPFKLYTNELSNLERLRSTKPIPDNLVHYLGKSFTSKGRDLDIALPSENGRWLLIGSDTGKPPVFDLWAGTANSSGHFYFELYDTASGDHQLLVDGHFRDISPSYFMLRNGWINDNFLLLSLNPDRTTFVLCDVSK